MNEAALFNLGWQISCRAQVSPVGEHNKELSLLSIGRVFDHPWRDFVRDVDCVAANSLANSVGRSESSNERCDSCHEKQ